MPQISLIIPVYNVDRYIGQCIQSIINQAFQDIEIILINDGSTDRSGEVCRKYAQIDSRIIYIETENRGTAAARNTGMEKAAGDWLCFVDGDDYLADNALELLLRGDANADVIVGNYFAYANGEIHPEKFFSDHISDEQKKTLLFLLGNALGSSFYGAVYQTNIGVPWAKLYRRQFCQNLKIHYPHLKRMQDTAFNIMVFQNTDKISFVDEAVYVYRITGESVVNRYTPDFNKTAYEMLEWIEVPIKNNPDVRIAELYNFKMLILVLETIKLSYLHPACPLRPLEIIKKIKALCIEKSVSKIFFGCNRRLFSKKQRILLKLLSRKQYVIVYCLYSWKIQLSYKNKRIC